MDHFERLFGTFTNRAFRLELLEEYRIEGSEWEEFQSFIAGTPVPQGANADWARDVASWIQAGKQVVRVRVLPSVVNLYIRYELDWCYPYNMKAGEDIRFIDRNSFAEIERPFGHIEDFWLFDESEVLEMKYSPDGSYLGEDLVDDTEKVKTYTTIANALLAKSISGAHLYSLYRKLPLQII